MDNRVKELREKNGLSQTKFAQMLGVSRQTINSLETGRYNPSILLAFKISKLFNLSIKKIFIYKEEESEQQ